MIVYEITEYIDKGREYFSVTGLMNVFDIMIAVNWILIFVLGGFWEIIVQIVTLGTLTAGELDAFQDEMGQFAVALFALQLVLISVRFLTLFQNTK